jgi:MFS transporter, putative metabolite:H+ symporter
MLDLLERQQELTINQWKIFVACTLSTMMEFFDFFLIGYVLAFFIGDWHLTYGQSGAILFSSGIAAVPGGWLFGWLGDRIGRRKVFMITVLMFSLGTGAMALTPGHNWPFLVVMRLVVGLGVGGMFVVDLPLITEFVPTSKRGFVSGLSTSMLPAGAILAASLSAFLGPTIGWRGLFLCGMVPVLMAFVIRLWVPESPRWLISQGRIVEARRSLAWALKVDPSAIVLPRAAVAPVRTSWLELFQYPRSLTAGMMIGLAQVGPAGLSLWTVVLFVMVLKVTPAEGAYLAIWIGIAGVAGRVVGSWLCEALGRRVSSTLTLLAATICLSLAGYLHDLFVGTVSFYFVLLMAHSFFGPGAAFAITFPFMTELWPGRLRTSGFGLTYGTANLGKFIGPAGLAVIAGTSNYVNPKATLAALVPAFNYFATWYLLAIVAIVFVAFETRGRSIEELDAALDKRVPATEPVS